MKPLKPQRQLSEIRVTRKSNLELKHGDGHGWAVSYADLLMVLLSFFVLYFNFSSDDPAKAKSEMIKIAMAMKGQVVEEKDLPSQTPKETNVAQTEASENAVKEASTAPQLPQGVLDQLKKSGMKVLSTKETLILEFQPGMYTKGNFKITKKLKTEIDHVMRQLKSFEKNISITVIGHTDTIPMRPRNELLTDNFDLSSIRALKVLKYLRSTGFSESSLNARAESSYSRAARTISFELKTKSTATDRSAASETL